MCTKKSNRVPRKMVALHSTKANLVQIRTERTHLAVNQVLSSEHALRLTDWTCIRPSLITRKWSRDQPIRHKGASTLTESGSAMSELRTKKNLIVTGRLLLTTQRRLDLASQCTWRQKSCLCLWSRRHSTRLYRRAKDSCKYRALRALLGQIRVANAPTSNFNAWINSWLP